MSIASEILARRMRLIGAETHAITHEPDLTVAADDGAILLTDRWVATAGLGRPQPTVLVRSPYGRTGFVGLMFGRMARRAGAAGGRAKRARDIRVGWKLHPLR